jgi:hypothetical protein
MHGISTKKMASQRWLMFSKLWLYYNEAQEVLDIQVYGILPLPTSSIQGTHESQHSTHRTTHSKHL